MLTEEKTKTVSKITNTEAHRTQTNSSSNLIPIAIAGLLLGGLGLLMSQEEEFVWQAPKEIKEIEITPTNHDAFEIRLVIAESYSTSRWKFRKLEDGSMQSMVTNIIYKTEADLVKSIAYRFNNRQSAEAVAHLIFNTLHQNIKIVFNS